MAEDRFDIHAIPHLIAVDDTPAAAFALRRGRRRTDQGSRLTLLTVVPDPPGVVAAAGISPRRVAEEMETEADTHLRHVAATLPQDLPVTTVLRHGDPAEEILRLAREEPIDLISIGARGRGRVTGALLGWCRPPCSTTARCPSSSCIHHASQSPPSEGSTSNASSP